jgi:hypothetical protein
MSKSFSITLDIRLKIVLCTYTAEIVIEIVTLVVVNETVDFLRICFSTTRHLSSVANFSHWALFEITSFNEFDSFKNGWFDCKQCAGSGNLQNVGVGIGKFYSVNVPFKDGIDDDTYTSTFIRYFLPVVVWLLLCGYFCWFFHLPSVSVYNTVLLGCWSLVTCWKH